MGRGGAWQQTTGFHRELVLHLQPERRRQYPSESREAGEGGEGTTGNRAVGCFRERWIESEPKQPFSPSHPSAPSRDNNLFLSMFPIQRGTANARMGKLFVPLTRTVPTTPSGDDTLAVAASVLPPGERLRCARPFGAGSMFFDCESTASLAPAPDRREPSKMTSRPVVRWVPATRNCGL